MLKNLISDIINSSLLRSAGTYGVFSLVNSAIPFFLMPLMTRYLSPADYGYVSLFNILQSIAVVLIGCNFAGAYSRSYFLPERFSASEYFNTVVFVTLISGIAWTSIVFVLSKRIVLLFSFPQNWLLLVPIAGTATCIVSIILVHWQVRTQPVQYGIFINMSTLFKVILSIVLIVCINFSWQGQIIAFTLTQVLFALLGLIILKKDMQCYCSISSSALRHALLFGLPLLPHALTGIIYSSINRIFISKMVGISETGLFTVGYQLGSIILLLATAFNQAYVPWLYNQLNCDKKNIKLKIVKLTYLYFLIILIIAILLSVISPFILYYFVGKDFQSSYIYIVWIALGFSFTGMYYMVVNYIFYQERTYCLSIITLLMCLLNLILNYFLIRMNGSVGAAQATTITSFVNFIAVWYVSAKIYAMPWLYFLK